MTKYFYPNLKDNQKVGNISILKKDDNDGTEDVVESTNEK